MANRDVLAIGTSAGGVEALMFLAKRFPADLPAAVLVTIHLSNQFPSSLDQILGGGGALTASFAKHGERVRRGHIYLAPPDRHLLLDGDRLHLGSGARENNTRPAIDPMLRSAALCCGPRAVGVVLTGTLGDGASGLWAVAKCGGLTVVQDPRDASFPDMPRNALKRIDPDHVVRLAEMPALLEALVQQPAGAPRPVPERIKFEVEMARGGSGVRDMDQLDKFGRRSVLTCPDCNGVMWEMDEGELMRFRCHVGHTYSAELMSVAIDENLRRALAAALRALDERMALAQKLHKQAVDDGAQAMAELWSRRVGEYRREADVIRGSIQHMEEISAGEQMKRAG